MTEGCNMLAVLEGWTMIKGCTMQHTWSRMQHSPAMPPRREEHLSISGPHDFVCSSSHEEIWTWWTGRPLCHAAMKPVLEASDRQGKYWLCANTNDDYCDYCGIST